MAKFLARMDVGKVNFDGRNPHSGDGVPQRDTGVSVGGGVDDDDLKFVLGLLNPIDQLAFEIGLAEVDFGPQPDGAFTVAAMRASSLRK